MSHLAFHAGDRENVDRLWLEAPNHGWSGLYKDRHPWAGGDPTSDDPGHYAAFLDNEERFKIELVAAPSSIRQTNAAEDLSEAQTAAWSQIATA